jgi:SSS family solute:Na+ symporter
LQWIDWLIVLVPLVLVLWLAIHSRRYVRGVADFLAAGRVAGRYVISVGDLQAGLAVVTLVAGSEQRYQCGLGVGFWGGVVTPITIFISLTGFVLYRFRQTRALSMGQFLETRYNRPLRIVAGFVRTVAEMITNAIGPAVAARFFIYFIGLPSSVSIFGVEISMYAFVVGLILFLAMMVIWPGGRISLLVTDALQGLMSYPIFVIFTVFVLTQMSWLHDVAPLMLDRVPGESYLNPMDVESLRDFNLFALVVTIIGQILNKGAWIGNDTSGCGRTPHEQKMAGILGAWRTGFAYMMMTLLGVFVIVVMQGDRFAGTAKEVRTVLINRISEKAVPDEQVRGELVSRTQAIPPSKHKHGEDEPYSQKNNPDTPYLNTAERVLDEAAATQIVARNLDTKSMEAESIKGKHKGMFQEFKTLYYQMMPPTILRMRLPVGLMGLFVLLMVMLMISTDDSRIFNASSTIVQDVIMPFRKKPFQRNEHLWWLRISALAVCVFFFCVSIFFAQLDFIAMFINIMCALWGGAAGPIILGGLYTRWGTTVGAFCALIFGSGTAFLGLIFKQNWADVIYPFLSYHGYLVYAQALFDFVTRWCAPLVVWEMSASKFPINSFEITFLAMVLGCLSYVIGSFLTCRKRYNLDRMLHRGEYSDGESKPPSPWTWKNVYSKLIGITEEYSRGDRIIAWSVFYYSIVWGFGFMFVGVAVWNFISPWPNEWWVWRSYIDTIILGIVVGGVSTVWFLIGGIVDIRRLFRDLAARIDNPLDDGWVEDHISLADRAKMKPEPEESEE